MGGEDGGAAGGLCELKLGNESQSAGRAHLIFLSASMLPEVQQSGLKALRSDDRSQQKKIKCVLVTLVRNVLLARHLEMDACYDSRRLPLVRACLFFRNNIVKFLWQRPNRCLYVSASGALLLF